MTEFRTVLVDFPWRLDDQLPGGGRGAGKFYSTMTVEDGCAMKLPPRARDAYLVFWRLASMVPEAYQIVAAWGATPVTEIVWVKVRTGRSQGMGWHLRNDHEVAIVAKWGKPKPLRHDVSTVFHAPVGRHSEKPDASYALIEAAMAGPRVELFARRRRPGWTTLGGEIR